MTTTNDAPATAICCSYCGDTRMITDRVDGEITCPECGYDAPAPAPSGLDPHDYDDGYQWARDVMNEPTALASDASPRGEPTQAEREAANSAFREWWDREQACPEHSMTTQNAAHAAWQEAYRVYRARPRGEAVAWVQKEALAELAKHKDATATISSGLLKKPFGNPVALYAHPAPAPAPAEVVEAGPFGAVMAEVRRATAKFPTWPTDPLHALAVLGEEFGELTKETLQLTYEPHKSTVEDFRKEAPQTAAMALRFLASLDAYQFTPAAQHQQNALASPAPASEREGSHG